MEEKKNTGLIWLIVVLIILVVGLMTFILYKEFYVNNRDNLDNTTNTTTNTTETTTKVVEKEIEIKKIEDLPVENDKTVIEKMVLEDKDLLKKIKDFEIKNSCKTTEEDNILSCKVSANNVDFFTYDYYKVVDSEPNYYTIYILEDYLVFTIETGMAAVYDFLLINKEGKIVFDTTRGDTVAFALNDIKHYKLDVNEDLPFIIFKNKIYFVANEFYDKTDGILGDDMLFCIDLQKNNIESIKLFYVEQKEN